MSDVEYSPLWHVYLLLCADGTLYTGVTTDCQRRLKEHNESNRLGAKYTRCRRPVTLVWHEPARNRSEACQREYAIKRLTRAEKLDLIS